MEKIFKLRDKSTGLFSAGGATNNFNKKGKIWKIKGHLKNHLSQFKRTYGYGDNQLIKNISNWEIVEYELVEKETTDLFTFLSDGDPKEEYLLLTTLERN